jgi:hypothetical protein
VAHNTHQLELKVTVILPLLGFLFDIRELCFFIEKVRIGLNSIICL